MIWTQVESDAPWDSAYLALTQPKEIVLLSDFAEPARPEAVSPVAVTSPFQLLTSAGVEKLRLISADLEKYARGNERISKWVRSGVYQSQFLRGLASDLDLLEFVSGLAQVPLAPHPMSHQAIHINYAPDDLSRHVVDDWHCDTSVSFDYVMMVSDPRPMKGGQFEYFLGPPREAAEILKTHADLPAERVVQPNFPGPGWAILMQGHQLMHRAHRLYERYPRVSLIGSFLSLHKQIPDPQDRIGPFVDTEPLEVALMEWARYTAVVGSRQLQEVAEATADLSLPLGEVHAALQRGIAGPLDAMAQIESRGFAEGSN